MIEAEWATPGEGRSYPAGAELVDGGVSFRVWAPRARTVDVLIDDGPRTSLTAGPGGYFEVIVPGIMAGARYRFSLDGGEPLPDPASRSQPDGPLGASEVIDSRAYAWQDGDWRGVALPGQVIYEFHVGTFTTPGTWEAAARRLPFLRDLGVTVLEMMPVNTFAGRFGWGYDGVDLFAPTRNYGRPDDLRAFVDQAHRLGLGVILDVVYNHFGPAGNIVGAFGPYTSDNHANDWGDSVNFDGECCAGVREFVAANAAYWIDEYHFDGLRIDATQALVDDGEEHILAVLTRAARAAAKGRSIIVVGENEPQHVEIMIPPERGGQGLDALWNDDLHHSALVALTGKSEAYFKDYEGSPQEFVSAAKYGFLFQGQTYAWQNQRRGRPTAGVARRQFVSFLENHDQVANSGPGDRLIRRTGPGHLRAATAMLLLMPATPMLFQGQEFASSRPFSYFADHEPDLAALVRNGRRGFLDQFQSIGEDAEAEVANPSAVATFEACKLDWDECERNQAWVDLHKDLLRLRREDPGFSGEDDGAFDGAVIGPDAFLLRWSPPGGDDRLLIVNFGRDIAKPSLAEPLAAPPEGCGWTLLWSSEARRYGGGGTPRIEGEHGWRIPGPAAFVLAPHPLAPAEKHP